MSKYQALIDALAGVDGQLGQPSLHSGHVIYAETEEWCSVDINVKLSANKHISGPLARFIKEAANPATIRAILADLERAEKAQAVVSRLLPLIFDCAQNKQHESVLALVTQMSTELAQMAGG